MPFAGAQKAVQEPEGLLGVPGVDGVGEIPRGDRSGFPQVRLDVIGTEPRALPVRGGEDLEQRTEPGEVLAQMVLDRLLGRAVEPHRTGPHPLPDPVGALPAGHPGRQHVPVRLDRGHQLGGDLTLTGRQDEDGAREGVVQIGQERRHFFGGEPADVAHHHDPPLGQKGRGGAAVRHRGQVHVVAAVVLDGQVAVVAPQQPVDGRLDGVGDQGGVVPVDKGYGQSGVGGHQVASITAASVSQMRLAARTSWARMMRHPRLTPRAWAAIVASARD